MMNNDLYNKVRNLISTRLNAKEMNLFLSVPQEKLSIFQTNGREGFRILKAHQDSSKLEYFSGSEVSMALGSLIENEHEVINAIFANAAEIVIQCYMNEDFSDILAFLAFKPHLKSDDELNEERRILGLSGKK